jgi:hypothetical protein
MPNDHAGLVILGAPKLPKEPLEEKAFGGQIQDGDLAEILIFDPSFLRDQKT